MTTRRRRPQAILLALWCAAAGAGIAAAQPAAAPADGATLFRRQCATCHTIDLSEPVRQGPPLFRIVGRKAGTADGFSYSPGLSRAGFVWDEARLDAWLTDPQAVIPGVVMLYRQSKPEIRAAIIAYLKELN